MIRSKRVNGYSDNAVLSEFYGLSTDTKPTENVATGSVFTEVDTGKTFLYDEEGEDWTEVESGSGGGGGGDSDFSTAEVTINAHVSGIADPDNYVLVDGLIVIVNDEYMEPTSIQLYENTSIPLKLALYKNITACGVAGLSRTTVDDVSITGAAEYDDGVIRITGNCTIDITATLGGNQ